MTRDAKMNELNNHQFRDRLNSIRSKYGELLTLSQVAEVFKYRTVTAVRKAHSRKTLAVKLYRFKSRSGYYAKANEVAESIEKMEVS